MDLPSQPGPDPHGRDAAFSRHWAANEGALQAFVRGRLSNPALVDDVLQEVSLTLWSKWDSFREGSNFLAWAKAVAHFKILRACHDEKNRPAAVSSELLDLMHPDAKPFDEEVDERIVHLRQCMQELGDEERQIILLRYEKGLEGKEIAEQMRKRANYVYKKIGAIRRQLHRCIQRRSRQSEESP